MRFYRGERTEKENRSLYGYGFTVSFTARSSFALSLSGSVPPGTEERLGKNMNDTTNKEKQFDVAGKRRIVIDGIPYTVMVFFRSDAKETGLEKVMKLACKEARQK